MVLFNNKSNQVPEIKPNQPQPSIAQQFPQNNSQTQNNQLQKPAELPKPEPVAQPQNQPQFPQIPKPQNSIPQQSIQQNHELTVTPELNIEKGTPLLGEQPFFVRIDKFREAKENFEAVHIKISEMEQILENLEYTKEQEDKELEEWKDDIAEMKNFLNNIDKEIFNKI